MIRVFYIKRKHQLYYHSIEGLFDVIMSNISKFCSTDVVMVKYSGGSPKVILKNILSFKPNNNVLYHITGDIHYMALVTGKNTVLTIHDIRSAINGNFFKKLYIKLFWFWLPAFFVKRITVISEFTKNELELIIPLWKHKIKVIPNPVNTLFQPNPYLFNSKCPIILCVGTKENKNLERVFESVKSISCHLHIIGYLNDFQIELLEGYKINYKNSVNLSQEEIINAYIKCDLLCFPSLYEGFGMPIIEAQATGRPVLTSNIGAMLEVGKNSACLVDPLDQNSIEQGIKVIIDDENYRNNLIKRGFENVKRFKIESIAKEYIKVYKDVLN